MDMTTNPTDPAPADCLTSASMVDSAHPAVRQFAESHGGGGTDQSRAVALYYAVRDGFRYDPYRVDMSIAGMRASQVVANGYGWCVPKAALLAAACRAVGIAARVGYADVRNHLSTERMRQTMSTDVFAWHGYADIWIEGAWRKATPAFNIELCERFGLQPLEFNGLQDSVYHAFDKAGNRHMEYLRQRGTYVDVPLEPMLKTFRDIYHRWMKSEGPFSSLSSSDWDADVARETRAAPDPG
jgi:transglutaminase-like putative cysteine protease